MRCCELFFSSTSSIRWEHKTTFSHGVKAITPHWLSLFKCERSRFALLSRLGCFFFFLRERWRVSSGAWLRLWSALGGFLLIKKRDSSVLISALVFLFIAEVAWNFGLLRCIIVRQILFLNLPREWATITESARGSVIVRESSFSVRHLLGWIAHMTLFSTSTAQCHFFFFFLSWT